MIPSWIVSLSLVFVLIPLVGLALRLRGPGALGEHADMGVVAHPRHALGVADDVVVEVGLDLPAMRRGVVGEHMAAGAMVGLYPDGHIRYLGTATGHGLATPVAPEPAERARGFLMAKGMEEDDGG